VPNTVLDLKEMLLQTTWIPFIPGPSFGKIGQNGIYHNDGAFVEKLYRWRALWYLPSAGG
jgi:hypothetical protein